jgi:hypothetical protein
MHPIHAKSTRICLCLSGYPMYSLEFSAASDMASDMPVKPPDGHPVTAAPTIHCMDITLEQPMQPQHDQGKLSISTATLSTLHPAQQTRVYSPPPISIFVPPSAVPASEHMTAAHSQQLPTSLKSLQGSSGAFRSNRRVLSSQLSPIGIDARA